MKTIYLFFFLLVALTVHCQDSLLYKKMVFEDGDSSMPYRLLLPKDYDTTKEYPLILVLHGSGERGSDNQAQLVHGSDLFLKDGVRKDYPAIVVFPQCRANSSWASISVGGEFGNRQFVFYKNAEPTEDMQLLEGLLKELQKEYAIDKKRLYVGGLSMGGFGTFELVRRNPKLFAAAFPICGGANPKIAKKLKKVDWWIFHGDADNVVPAKYSTQMVKALEAVGATVTYTLYPNVGHNSWENAFAEPELLPWLFSKSK